MPSNNGCVLVKDKQQQHHKQHHTTNMTTTTTTAATLCCDHDSNDFYGDDSYEIIRSSVHAINDDDDEIELRLRSSNSKFGAKRSYGAGTANNEAQRQLLLTSESMRVLILTESFHPYTSGIARRFKEIIRRLAKRGFLIHVVTGCKGCETWAAELNLGANVTFSSLIAIEFKDKIDCALPFLLPQYGVLRDILKFKPDVIHCVEHTPASTFCGALCKALDIPLVWSSHTNLDFYIPLYIHPAIAPLSLRVYQLLRRTFLNMADYNLSVSSDFVKLLSENGIRKTVHVWKTGVDSESFNPKYRSHEMRLKMFNGHYSADKTLLVSVGRISPEKNFDFLLKILEKCPNTFLCIVGGGPYKESLEPLFPPKQTHFMGFLQGEQLAAAYASADYFVYASVSETFGQVYLEAMSSGTPIVAAEGKQMKEFFTNGIHGFTWKPDDVDSAVQALNEAMKNRHALSYNCRSHALNHSWNSAANQIADIYSRFKAPSSVVNSEQNSSIRAVSVCVRKVARGVYYLSKWLYIMILVLLFMAPFMKVVKPTKQQQQQTPVNESQPSQQQLIQPETANTRAATKEKPKRARKNRRKAEQRQESVESLGLSSADEPRKCLLDDEDNQSSISSSSTNISTNTANSASSGGLSSSSSNSSSSRRRRRNKKPAIASSETSTINSNASRRRVKKSPKKTAVVQNGFFALILRTVTYFVGLVFPTSLLHRTKKQTNKQRNSNDSTNVHETRNHHDNNTDTYSPPRPEFLASKSEAYINELVQKSAKYLSALGALFLSLLSLTALFLFMNTSAAFFPPAVAA